jgi:predicted acylesterase/phospholipase RssA
MEYNAHGHPMPETILFASGGIRGITYVGALEVLHKHGCLRKVRTWAGVSVGAFFATAMAIGFTVAELRQICLKFDFGVLKNINEESPLRLFDSYGLDSGEKMVRFLHAVMRVKGVSKHITFRELPADVELKIWATNVTQARLELYSRATTPSMEIVDAIRASASIPVLFDPCHNSTGDHIVDGAVMNAFPIAELAQAERDKTLGMNTLSPIKARQCDNFVSYICKAIRIGFELRSLTNAVYYNKHLILINTAVSDVTKFDLDESTRKVLIDCGATDTEAYLGAVGRVLPARRHSF